MDCGPPDFSVHGIFPGKNTGVGCYALLQGIFPTQGSNPGLLHCRQILYRLEKSIHLLSGHINRQRTPQTISWRRSKILVFYQNATTINEQKWESILLSRIWMLSLMIFGEDYGVGRGGGREKKILQKTFKIIVMKYYSFDLWWKKGTVKYIHH